MLGRVTGAWVAGAILSLVILAAAPEAGTDDVERPAFVAEVERLLWDAATADARDGMVIRAGQALARMWQDDPDALCHLTAVMAGHGLTGNAAAVCQRALRASPTEACATFCSLHFALWSCDFDSLDALQARVTASVQASVQRGSEGTPASVGHLEALLVLPGPLLVRHLLQQAQFIRAASSETADYRHAAPVPGRVLPLAILTSTARQHPHGYALLAALRGVRQQSGVRVACFDTSHVLPDEGRDDVTLQIAQLCDDWFDCQECSAVQIAEAVNAQGSLATVDADGWTSPRGGSLHVAALLHRPSILSVGALGVVSPSYAADAHDFLVTDAVASPPELMSATHLRGCDVSGRLLAFGHPGRGGLTSFVSGLSVDAAQAGFQPPRIAGLTASRANDAPKLDAPPSHAQRNAGSEDQDEGARRRAATGLPEDALLLGCFHAEYKISRQLVAMAARVLLSSDRVVFWLGFVSATARRRVAAELQRNGVREPGDRVFMLPGNIQGSHHLEIKAQVDLALDSPVYNGHSSSADLLWAAVPTVIGRAPSLAACLVGGRVSAVLPAGVTLKCPALVPCCPSRTPAARANVKAGQLTAAGHTEINRLAASILLSGPGCLGYGQPHSAGSGGFSYGGGWVAATLGRNSEDVIEIATKLVSKQYKLARLRRKLKGLRECWGPFRPGDWAARLLRGVRMAADAAILRDAGSVAHRDAPGVEHDRDDAARRGRRAAGSVGIASVPLYHVLVAR